MKIDLTKTGFECFFTPWQIELLEILYQNEQHTSATLTESLNKRLSDGGVSRASVIGFMKELEAWSIATVFLDTKQGGEYRVYNFNHTKASLWAYLRMIAEACLREGDKLYDSSTKQSNRRQTNG